MAKKNRNRSKKARREKAIENRKRARIRNISITAVIILIVAAGLIMSADGDLPEARGGETRQTLAPRLFPGNVARAYAVAREIPEILDKIYCYCKCQENIGHKSLLTCFVDKHGSRCGICMNEALIAFDLYKKGYPTGDIVEKVQATMANRKGGNR